MFILNLHLADLVRQQAIKLNTYLLNYKQVYPLRHNKMKISRNVYNPNDNNGIVRYAPSKELDRLNILKLITIYNKFNNIMAIIFNNY